MSDEELVDDDIDKLVEAFHQGKITGEAFLERGGSDAYQDEQVACFHWGESRVHFFQMRLRS